LTGNPKPNIILTK